MLIFWDSYTDWEFLTKSHKMTIREFFYKIALLWPKRSAVENLLRVQIGEA